jgi:Tol biopolymer transport system component
MKRSLIAVGLVTLAAVAASVTALASAGEFSSWSPATRVEAIPGTDPSFNGAGLDGCPFVSRDGKQFYMASNRLGGLGGIDIWVASRDSADEPWGAPVNVGAPVNSAANDFCPTIARDGHLFYFVSNRPGGCGGDDIYTTRLRASGWDPVVNLGCDVNSAANEASPMPLPERSTGPVLYFSSTRPGGFSAEAPGATAGDSDLYVSPSHGGTFGTAELVAGANSAAEDGQPNLRRDGLELFFFSTRPGTLGMADLYSATRAAGSDPWSTPVNLGAGVNSAAAETRPSLSWDGTTLYFGSTRPGGEGSSDHYVTTRERLNSN